MLIRALGVIVLAGLLGCTDAAPPAATAVVEAEPDAVGAASGEMTPTDTEIDAMLERVGFEPSATREFDQTLLIEEAIQRCMAEQGFVYAPNIPSEDAVTVDERDLVERARRRGFGMTTWFGVEQEVVIDETPIPENPNDAQVAAMSEGEREAWLDALGVQSEGLSDDAEQGRWGTGCQHEAREAVFGEGPQDGLTWEVLHDAEDAMREAFLADPRIVAIDEEVSRCLAERGFADLHHGFPMEEWMRRLDEIISGALDPGVFGGGALAGLTEAEIEQLDEDPQAQAAHIAAWQLAQLNPTQQQALAELQQEERDAAVAYFECTRVRDAMWADVQAEYQRRFVEENWDTLVQLGAGSR